MDASMVREELVELSRMHNLHNNLVHEYGERWSKYLAAHCTIHLWTCQKCNLEKDIDRLERKIHGLGPQGPPPDPDRLQNQRRH
jgi:hypothetical protein